MSPSRRSGTLLTRVLGRASHDLSPSAARVRIAFFGPTSTQQLRAGASRGVPCVSRPISGQSDDQQERDDPGRFETMWNFCGSVS